MSKWFRRVVLVLVAAAVMVPASGGLLPQSGEPRPAGVNTTIDARRSGASVMVMGEPAAIRAAVLAEGGTIEFALSAGTIAATVPADRIAALSATAGVKQVFPDGPVVSTKRDDDDTITAQVWEQAAHLTDAAHGPAGINGTGVTVAVVDTGLNPASGGAFAHQLPGPFGDQDAIGHGTHVAGIIAAKKVNSQGGSGAAPDANVIGVRVIGDSNGAIRVSHLVRAIDWVVANKARYNIRVLNISATAATPGSYLTSILDAAVERAWFSGIVVVVSAGNNGFGQDAVSVAPANDPFVITVGAFDDKGTQSLADDELASWSSRGVTRDHIAKPDVVAPGRHIVSLLAAGSPLFADNGQVIDNKYLQLSGTSMSAPVVSGVAALILEKNPSLNPDQVKARITGSADPLSGSAAGRVNAYSAVFGPDRGLANRAGGLHLNLILASAAHLLDLRAVNWGSVSWDSISWDSISWDTVNWGSVSWDSISWDSISWDSASWDAIKTSSISWDSISWDSTAWATVQDK